MKTPTHTLPALVVAMASVSLGVTAPLAWGGGSSKVIPLSVAEIYFELNDTDGDLGFHALIDGEPWKRISIWDTKRKKLLEVTNRGRLRRQGQTELFFESAEPGFDELPPKVFFRRFPEGMYQVTGTTLDGGRLRSRAEITHAMPSPPRMFVNGIPAAEDCDVDPLPKVNPPVRISWSPVTLSHPDLGTTSIPITVVHYQVVVEEETTGLVSSVLLPPSATRVRIPPELTALGSFFKFEVLVREESGNQTARESCFELHRS